MSGRGHSQNRHRGCRGGGLPSFSRGSPLSWISLAEDLLRLTFPVRLPRMRRSILKMKYSERLMIMRWRLKERSEFRLAIPLICACIGRPVALSLQPVEPCPQTPTRDISMRTGFPIFLTSVGGMKYLAIAS